MTLDAAAQTMIMVCGFFTIWLQCRPEEKIRRWWFLLGLLAEPAFFYTTILHHQWGMVCLTTWYTINMIYGVYTNWYKREKIDERIQLRS